jgi:hypothetical protein
MYVGILDLASTGSFVTLNLYKVKRESHRVWY